MEKDAQRETRLLELKLNSKERRKRSATNAKERAEASDRIVRILQEYGMMSGDEAADYYQYTLKEIEHVSTFTSSPSDYMRKVSPTKIQNPHHHHHHHHGVKEDSKQHSQKHKHDSKEHSKNDNLTAIDVYEPSANSYAPIPSKADARTFKKAGLEQVWGLNYKKTNVTLFPCCFFGFFWIYFFTNVSISFRVV
jgi:hypothetical protein